LVDTAYLGRLGPEVLGGAGVAISAQYAVSKLYNDPLLRTSISMVASKEGKTRGNKGESERDALSIEVSSALLLAFVVGFVQLVIYSVLAKGITMGMGVQETSPMWYSAVSYLRVRALGK
jgi:Na+-driven multidrug efflux pump